MAFPHAHFSCSPVLNHHLRPSSTRRRERDRMVAWAKHGTACQDCSSEQDDSGEDMRFLRQSRGIGAERAECSFGHLATSTPCEPREKAFP